MFGRRIKNADGVSAEVRAISAKVRTISAEVRTIPAEVRTEVDHANVNPCAWNEAKRNPTR